MAYLARIETTNGDRAGPAQAARPEPGFTEREWAIIRFARGDGLSTIREPGPLRRFYNRLIGRKSNPRLASDRLEALRRMAVLSWHFGFSVPGEDVADFLSAGFTPEQYELLVSSVRAAPKLQIVSGEVSA
jgi:hypothetical protein